MFDLLLVILAVAGAAFFLVRRWRRTVRNQGTGCGCGTSCGGAQGDCQELPLYGCPGCGSQKKDC